MRTGRKKILVFRKSVKVILQQNVSTDIYNRLDRLFHVIDNAIGYNQQYKIFSAIETRRFGNTEKKQPKNV
jgi:hypothetical protein